MNSLDKIIMGLQILRANGYTEIRIGVGMIICEDGVIDSPDDVELLEKLGWDWIGHIPTPCWRYYIHA